MTCKINYTSMLSPFHHCSCFSQIFTDHISTYYKTLFICSSSCINTEVKPRFINTQARFLTNFECGLFRILYSQESLIVLIVSWNMCVC